MTESATPAPEMGDERVVIDPATKSGRELSHLLNAIVAPRPIAWVSTVSSDGIPNLAPHSYTTVLSPNPPIVAFTSIGEKDTLRNVREVGDFAYNVGGEALLDEINLSAANFPPEESEFAWTGLTPVPCDLIRSPRVGEAPLSMEAKLEQVLQIAGSDNYLVMGRVVRMHIAPEVLDGDRIIPARIRPPSRLGGSQFNLFGEVVSHKRPTWIGLLETGARPRTTDRQE